MDNSPVQPITRLLLELCAAPDSDCTENCRALRAEDWAMLVDMAMDYRLVPLLLRAIEASQARALVPADVLADLEANRRWVKLKTLSQMAAAARITRMLREDGIQPLFIKGFGLGIAYYPDPVLRPMRDFDLLLPKSLAEQAQQRLLEETDIRHLPETDTYEGLAPHHLRPLEDVTFAQTLEIHHRPIATENWSGEAALTAMLTTQWSDIPILDSTARVPTALPNLILLVAHSTLQHRLDNGPFSQICISSSRTAASTGQNLSRPRIGWVSLTPFTSSLHWQRCMVPNGLIHVWRMGLLQRCHLSQRRGNRSFPSQATSVITRCSTGLKMSLHCPAAGSRDWVQQRSLHSIRTGCSLHDWQVLQSTAHGDIKPIRDGFSIG